MRDANEWDDIVRDVPFFREHDVYTIGEGPDAYNVAVLPGESPPRGGKLKYRVDGPRLRKIAAKINANIDRHEKPIKLFAGHTRGPKDQKNQPDLVGYGGRVRVGAWGPEKISAILGPLFIEKGQLETARKLPERSPEFYPNSDEMTAMALLVTDPKLPMGMVTYTAETVCNGLGYALPDGAVFYGRGFDVGTNNGKRGKNYERDSEGHGFDDNDDVERNGAMARVRKKDYAEDDDDDDKNKEDDLEDLNPEEAHQAARYAKHYEKHHPVFKYMCGKYAADMADAGPTNGALPGDAPPPKNKEDEDMPPKKREEEAEDMVRRDTDMIKMQKDLVTQSRELARLRLKDRSGEVAKRLTALAQKVIIPEKVAPRLAEQYMKADEKEWPGIDEIVLEAYAKRNTDPTEDPWVPAPPDQYARENEGPLCVQFRVDAQLDCVWLT